jgi:anti-sigma factor RsiW
MTHPSQDSLLLFAYGELPEVEASDVETHLAHCAACHESFRQLERARIAVEWAVPAGSLKGYRAAAFAALAVAAVVAVVMLARPEQPEATGVWRSNPAWSATAGYIAGGSPVIEIDAQLTRLERSYGYPD